MSECVSKIPDLLTKPKQEPMNEVCTKDRCLTEKLFQDSLCKDLKWLNFVKWETEHFLTNFTQLDLSRTIIFQDRLKLIFEKNKKIRHVTLGFLKLIYCCSLLKLNPNLIEVLVLKYFSVDSGETLSIFLSQFQSLKQLEISVLNIDVHEIVDTLNKDVINEMKFLEFSNKPEFNIVLKELLINQKLLDKIHLRTLPRELIESIISWNNISSIHLEYLTEELLNALDKFVNLTFLRSCMGNCTDDEIKKIAKCIKLRELHLIMGNFDITEKGAHYFVNLRDLEFLSIEVADKRENLDYCFLGFSKCKQLKKLNLIGFQFKEIKEYDPFSNLENFEIIFSDINSSSLIEIIAKSEKLKFCKIEHCKNITQECVNQINNNRSNAGLHLDFVEVKYDHLGGPFFSKSNKRCCTIL